MTPLDLSLPVTSEPVVIPVIQETLKTLSERMGKIAQAVTLISTVVRDPYQLSSHLMRHTTQTLADTHTLEYAPEMVTVHDVNRVSIGIRHIIDSCELCHTAGLMSDMNYQILVNELRQVQQFVHEKLSAYCIGQVTYPLRVPETESAISSQPALNNYFNQDYSADKKTAEQFVPSVKSQEVEPTPVQQVLTQSEKNNKPVFTTAASQTLKEMPKPAERHHEAPKILSPILVKQVSGEDKKERRDAIMKTIRSKGQVTIKDISENIRGCSEKTIQRDLQELIQHGVLIREGEKRWAVYKLAMKNV